MNLSVKSVTLFVAMCCLVASASAKELVREFRGSNTTYTAEFSARAPWIVDWRVASSLAPQIEVVLLKAGTNAFVGSILETKETGNGVRLFNESGRYLFKVNATMADWTLRVEELTRDEANLYTPTAKN